MITSEQIAETQAFQNIDKSTRQLYLKRKNREIINHAVTVFQNTGELQGGLCVHSLAIVRELISSN